MRIRLLALAVAASTMASAHAMDLLQAWDGARRQAPELALADAQDRAGAARQDQARAVWRPTIGMEGAAAWATNETATRGAQFSAPGFGESRGVSFDTSVTGGTSTRYAIAFRQPVWNAERSARSRGLAVAGTAAALEAERTRQLLMLRTVEAYFDASLAARRLALVETQLAAVERAASEARDRFKLGDRPVTEVHEAEARAAALRAQRLEAETQARLARAALADLTGLDATASPPRLAAEVAPESAGALDGWLARAAQSNTLLQLAAAQFDGAQARREATRGALSPTVDVVAHYGRDRITGDGDFGNASNTSRNAAIGVQVSIPLYTGGLRSAQDAESLALVDQARAQLERAKLDVAHEARAAWMALDVGAARVNSLAAALEASRLRLDATRTGLAAGDRTTLDLLNAENDAAGARLALDVARARLLIDRVRLAFVAGELDDSLLRKLNARLQAP